MALVSSESFQVWDFSKATSRADGTVAAGRFLGGGATISTFGIAILRIHLDTIAAITNSGDQLELWNVDSRQKERNDRDTSTEDDQRALCQCAIPQSTMATSLYLDHEYPSQVLFSLVSLYSCIREFFADVFFLNSQLCSPQHVYSFWSF